MLNKNLFLQEKFICFGTQSPTYTPILFTSNILHSQLILSRDFDKEFIYLFNYKVFSNICFTLFLIYFKYILWTIYRPKTEGLLDEKIRDSIFFKTSTLDVNYDRYHRRESLHLIQKSSNQSHSCETKTARANREWSEMMKTRQPKPIGIIGKAYSFWLSYHYLTINKCA